MADPHDVGPSKSSDTRRSKYSPKQSHLHSDPPVVRDGKQSVWSVASNRNQSLWSAASDALKTQAETARSTMTTTASVGSRLSFVTWPLQDHWTLPGATLRQARLDFRSRTDTKETVAEEEDDDTNSIALTVSLPPELVRGAPLQEVLGCFGRHFGSNPGAADYEKSLQTESIDDFISHDWQTGRWRKYVALCVIYNCRAALGFSVLLGLLLGFLQTD
eukprot:TRINITY_DN45352_c0_g1_i1.p1 TRINITY_DN45352_c0_g1~~TRINITY_DN45352_c0_g1_i1.p1  ORF type:complete len:218 (+),score=29.20 TRINITY_DN45352_c0_g1_i1:149-802(+)